MFKSLIVMLLVILVQCADLVWAQGKSPTNYMNYVIRATAIQLELNAHILVGLDEIARLMCSQNYTKECDVIFKNQTRLKARHNLMSTVTALTSSLHNSAARLPDSNRAQDAAGCRFSARRQVRPGDARSFIDKGWKETEVDTLADLCMKAKGYKIERKPEVSVDAPSQGTEE